MSQDCEFDVIVVGAGHAGCEAAMASSRIGARTLLISQKIDDVASMPCNPSIGGLAKSHLVFELDALGGEMAKNADFTGINFKTLNTSRGPAVFANRCQCDKNLYSRRMSRTVARTPGLRTKQSMAVNILMMKPGFEVVTADGGKLKTRSLVLCPGTSMNGTIHLGAQSWPGGGNGANSTNAISDFLLSFWRFYGPHEDRDSSQARRKNY